MINFKKNSVILVVVCMVFILMSIFYFMNKKLNDSLENNQKSIVKYKVDLNQNGLKETILLENKSSDIYLTVNDFDFLLIENYCDPDYEFYSMSLDFLEFLDGKLVLVTLNQFINGAGSNIDSFIISYSNEQVEKIWDTNYKYAMPSITSEYDGEYLKFYDEENHFISKLLYSDSLASDENIQKKFEENYFITFPVKSEVSSIDGNYMLTLTHLLRGEKFHGFYVEEHLIMEDAVIFYRGYVTDIE